MIKNPPAMQDTRVQFLDWEDPPEKGMALHSSILAWRIPWTEEPGRLQSIESQRVDTTEQLTLSWSGNNVSVNLHQTSVILCSDKKGRGLQA